MFLTIIEYIQPTRELLSTHYLPRTIVMLGVVDCTLHEIHGSGAEQRTHTNSTGLHRCSSSLAGRRRRWGLSRCVRGSSRSVEARRGAGLT
jgi:hypothetical protein